MKLSIAALTAVGLASASAKTISVNSKKGRSIMSKARRLDGDDGDATWAADYSIQFQKCATSNDYYGSYFGGDGENQNNDNNNGNGNGYNGIYEQRLVHFKLCPSGTCAGNCAGGADYVVDMNEFVAAYIENKLETEEATCEAAKENCEYYCENANDDEACENQCLYNDGLSYCMENDNNNNNNGQQEEFELEEAVECMELEVDEDAAQYYAYENGMSNYQYQNGNNNNNNNGNDAEIKFFVGPYCSSNGKSINLGVFMDETCSFDAPKGVYEKFFYGNSLPYSSESLVTNECISCMAPKDEDEDENQNGNNNNNNYYYNNNNNNNNNQDDQEQEEDEIKEFCGRLYEEAGKCETDLNVYGVYPNTMGCEFISNLGKTNVFSSIASATKNNTPAVLASLFAVTTVVFAGVSYHFHKKTQRATIGLNSGGAMA